MTGGTFIFRGYGKGSFPVMAGPAGFSPSHRSHGYALVFLRGHIQTGVTFLASQPYILHMIIMAEDDFFGLLGFENDIPPANLP